MFFPGTTITTKISVSSKLYHTRHPTANGLNSRPARRFSMPEFIRSDAKRRAVMVILPYLNKAERRLFVHTLFTSAGQPVYSSVRNKLK